MLKIKKSIYSSGLSFSIFGIIYFYSTTKFNLLLNLLFTAQWLIIGFFAVLLVANINSNLVTQGVGTLLKRKAVIKIFVLQLIWLVTIVWLLSNILYFTHANSKLTGYQVNFIQLWRQDYFGLLWFGLELPLIQYLAVKFLLQSNNPNHSYNHSHNPNHNHDLWLICCKKYTNSKILSFLYHAQITMINSSKIFLLIILLAMAILSFAYGFCISCGFNIYEQYELFVITILFLGLLCRKQALVAFGFGVRKGYSLGAMLAGLLLVILLGTIFVLPIMQFFAFYPLQAIRLRSAFDHIALQAGLDDRFLLFLASIFILSSIEIYRKLDKIFTKQKLWQIILIYNLLPVLLFGIFSFNGEVLNSSLLLDFMVQPNVQMLNGLLAIVLVYFLYSKVYVMNDWAYDILADNSKEKNRSIFPIIKRLYPGVFLSIVVHFVFTWYFAASLVTTGCVCVILVTVAVVVASFFEMIRRRSTYLNYFIH